MKATTKKFKSDAVIPRVYIAYSITSALKSRAASKKISDWKSELVQSLANKILFFELLDPIRYGLDNSHDWQEIIRRNSRDISRSDFLIAYLDLPSFGVASEIMMAHSMGVDIVGYSSFGYLAQSPYVKREIEYVSESIKDIANYIAEKCHAKV